MSDAAAIDVQSLDKTVRVGFFGKRVDILAGVTLRVERGSTTGFVGKNGAGKSTTIKHVIGGARPTAGTVRVFGGDPRDPAVRTRFGYMPELPYLPPTLTPREMMTLHAALCGAPVARIAPLLERVDLARDAHKRVGTFSKGMQTRLCLALALLQEPELLILDEPMSGLDPVGRTLVRTLLREQAAVGRTIFFSSHVLSDVEALCDRVVVIDGGRVVHSGTTAQAVGEEGPSAWAVRVKAADGSALPGVKEARKEGDTWLVVVEGGDAVAAAARLQGAGATVMSLEPKRASLEERVVHLLGRAS